MPDGIAAWFDKYPDPATTPAYTAGDERLLSTVLAMPASPTLARPGVRPGGSPTVTVDGTAMTVTVGAHSGIITDTAAGGSWLYAIPAAVTKSIGSRPGGGTSRIASVVARIKNDEVRPADGAREVEIFVILGTAGSSPVADTVPTGQLRLAELAIPASGTVSVSKPAQRTAAAGGILNLGSQAEEDALTGSLVWDGLVIYREDTDVLKARVGGAWQTVILDTGWQALTLTGVTGWTVAVARGAKAGQRVDLDIQVTRSGATLTAGSDGNVAETAICTGGIPADWLPADAITLMGARRTTWGVGFNLDETGALGLSFIGAGGTVPNGTLLRLRDSYRLG